MRDERQKTWESWREPKPTIEIANWDSIGTRLGLVWDSFGTVIRTGRTKRDRRNRSLSRAVLNVANEGFDSIEDFSINRRKANNNENGGDFWLFEFPASLRGDEPKPDWVLPCMEWLPSWWGASEAEGNIALEEKLEIHGSKKWTKRGELKNETWKKRRLCESVAVWSSVTGTGRCFIWLPSVKIKEFSMGRSLNSWTISDKTRISLSAPPIVNEDKT